MDDKTYKKIIDEAFGCYKNVDYIKFSIMLRKDDILEACKNDNETLPDDLKVIQKRIVGVVQACVCVYRDGFINGYKTGYDEGLKDKDIFEEEGE